MYNSSFYFVQKAREFCISFFQWRQKVLFGFHINKDIFSLLNLYLLIANSTFTWSLFGENNRLLWISHKIQIEHIICKRNNTLFDKKFICLSLRIYNTLINSQSHFE